MSNKDLVIKTLDELHITYRWVDHPAVFTVAESVQLIKGKKPIKNLLLKEKGGDRKVLVIMAGDQKLDTKMVAQKLNSRKLHFADSETLLATLGVSPGAVSVFGLLNKGAMGVEVVLDKRLLDEKELGFHPNENTATIFIPSSALIDILKHTGNRYYTLQLY